MLLLFLLITNKSFIHTPHIVQLNKQLVDGMTQILLGWLLLVKCNKEQHVSVLYKRLKIDWMSVIWFDKVNHSFFSSSSSCWWKTMDFFVSTFLTSIVFNSFVVVTKIGILSGVVERFFNFSNFSQGQVVGMIIFL